MKKILSILVAAFALSATPLLAQNLTANTINFGGVKVRYTSGTGVPTDVCTDLLHYLQTDGTIGQNLWICVSGHMKQQGTASGSMVYPSSGIPVSTGSAWTTPKAVPSGALVGTDDSQTLTNKVVDGATAAEIGYVAGVTSSIQTQLNGKLGTAGNGSSLTALNGSAIASGTVPVARLPVFIASGGSHAAGIVPDPGSTSGTTRFLREDGTWAVPAGGGGSGSTITCSITNGIVYWDGSAYVCDSSLFVPGSGGQVLASGVIDGLTAVYITTGTTVAVAPVTTGGPCDNTKTGARACQGAQYYNNVTGGTAAVTYTLPAASVAGKVYCFDNFPGVSSLMTIQTSGSGQYIAWQGANTTSGGYLTMGGALGDSVCVKSATSTQWFANSAQGNVTPH